MPASYSVPRDWTTGELVTAALMNTHLRDMMMYFYSKRLDVLIYQDQKSSGTAADNITNAAWSTRVLNTEVNDTGSHGTLASNQISLAAGVYLSIFTAGLAGNLTHQLRLRNVTDSATLGQSVSATASNTPTMGFGLFTSTATKLVELQHWINTTPGSTAGGSAASTGSVEVYAQVLLIRVGD